MPNVGTPNAGAPEPAAAAPSSASRRSVPFVIDCVHDLIFDGYQIDVDALD